MNSNLYWCIALGNFGSCLSWISFIVAAAGLFGSFITYVDDNKDDEELRFSYKLFIIGTIFALVFVLSWLIPNSQQFCKIYGLS